MPPDQRLILIIAIPVVLGLELWRRSLKNRAPRWMYIVAALLVMAIAGGVAYSQWQLSHLREVIKDVEVSYKASVLSEGISSAMTGNAIAFVCTVAAICMLGFATWKARGVPDDGPAARVVE